MSRKQKVIYNVYVDKWTQDGEETRQNTFFTAREYDQIVNEIKENGLDKYATSRIIYRIQQNIIEVHIKIDMRERYIVLYDWMGGNTATQTDYEIADSLEEVQPTIDSIIEEYGKSYIEVFALGDDVSDKFINTKQCWQ